MSIEVKHQWPLKRYARFVNENKETNTENEESNWLHIESRNDMILAYLQTEQVVVMKGDVVEESFPLANSQSSIRAITKGDSLLIAFKLENSVRRFRVQFDAINDKTGKEQCEEFVKIFSPFFSIKCTSPNKAKCLFPMEKSNLSGTVTLDSIIEAIHGNSEFPSVYNNTLSNMEPNNLQSLVYTCLFDPTFPKFVSDVEKVLQNIIKKN